MKGASEQATRTMMIVAVALILLMVIILVSPGVADFALQLTSALLNDLLYFFYGPHVKI